MCCAYMMCGGVLQLEYVAGILKLLALYRQMWIMYSICERNPHGSLLDGGTGINMLCLELELDSIEPCQRVSCQALLSFSDQRCCN